MLVLRSATRSHPLATQKHGMAPRQIRAAASGATTSRKAVRMQAKSNAAPRCEDKDTALARGCAQERVRPKPNADKRNAHGSLRSQEAQQVLND